MTPARAIRYRRESFLGRGPVDFDRIVDTVATYYGQDRSKIVAKARGRLAVSFSRQVSMKLAYEAGASQIAIGAFFGRYPSDVCHAMQRVQDLCDVDKVVRQEVQEIRGRLSA